jgi:hypothetical protein
MDEALTWHELWADHGVAAAWTTVGAVFTLLVALAVFWWQRQTKAMGWRFVSDEWVLSDDLDGDLVVTFDGVKIVRPRLTVLRVFNTGRAGIEVGDFRKPITVRLPGSIVRQVSIARHSKRFLPLGYTVRKYGDAFEFRDVFFNQRAWVMRSTSSAAGNAEIAESVIRLAVRPVIAGVCR